MQLRPSPKLVFVITLFRTNEGGGYIGPLSLIYIHAGLWPVDAVTDANRSCTKRSSNGRLTTCSAA